MCNIAHIQSLAPKNAAPPLSLVFSSDDLPVRPAFSCDDGHGDYNRSYEQDTDDFDYADYSTAREDNNFLNRQKKKKKSQKQIIEDILNRWN